MTAENDLIAALATPLGTAALAVIRTAGPGCVEAVARFTDRPTRFRETPGGRMRKVSLHDPDSGIALDEVMCAVFRAPHSYTGDESVEIYCHGSIPGIHSILELLHRNGFRAAEPGEFTMRAFLAGKVDLTRAEAVQEIVRSRTAQGHVLALRRLGGSVEEAINRSKTELVRMMAAVAIQLDYPEEETGEIPLPLEPVRRVRADLEELIGSYRTGRLYQEGVQVALAGRTNAGKSSLFNALLKEDRAIVSEIHGTTRDYIEGWIDLDGVPVRVYDTAGLRKTDETIEGEGIRRTGRVLEAADLVLYLVDGIEGLTSEDEELIRSFSTPGPGRGERFVPIWNKIDDRRCQEVPEGFLPVSAVALTGMEDLVRAVTARVMPRERHPENSPVIDSLRQKNLLQRAAAALREVEQALFRNTPVDAISIDLQEAIHALGEITGEVTSADILDEVFRGFCVGK
jgi:tRNA modification GTPase